MPFISAVNLVQFQESDQTDNLSTVNAPTVEVDDSFYVNFSASQTLITDSVDRLNVFETTASVNLEALQVPRRTIKFGG